MVAHTVDVAEAQLRLADLIAEAQQGAEVIITSHDQPVARIVPLAAPMPRRRAGSAAGLITMSDDFDEPLEDFKEYME